jgi:hypothetical protein
MRLTFRATEYQGLPNTPACAVVGPVGDGVVGCRSGTVGSVRGVDDQALFARWQDLHISDLVCARAFETRGWESLSKAVWSGLMDCLATGKAVEPIRVAAGVLQCPACREIVDDQTLRSLAEHGDDVFIVHRKSAPRWGLAGGPRRGDAGTPLTNEA